MKQAPTLEEVRRLLAEDSDDEPPIIPLALLKYIDANDLREGTNVEVGTRAPDGYHMEWQGRLYRSGDTITGEAEHIWWRKHWNSALGIEHYMDLVRRAVETRHRVRGDVTFTGYDDDGGHVFLGFSIPTTESNLAKAYQHVRRIADEVEEAAEQAANEVEKHVAQVAARLSGWGSEPLDSLVEKVETAHSPDDKGRSLEELVSRLFSQIPGFVVTGRIRTATEEIDISVVNDAAEPRLRRESALILAECKNWTSKCGKDEFVIFREKLENRKRRCSLGFLISWNGFASTVTKEMLRSSKDETLIVPVTGSQIRAAVRSGDAQNELLRWWDAAVQL